MYYEQLLFPAHAGVIPEGMAKKELNLPFPRPRGGDPRRTAFDGVGWCFSPPTRG